jgi:hypothetical protein
MVDMSVWLAQDAANHAASDSMIRRTSITVFKKVNLSSTCRRQRQGLLFTKAFHRRQLNKHRIIESYYVQPPDQVNQKIEPT